MFMSALKDPAMVSSFKYTFVSNYNKVVNLDLKITPTHINSHLTSHIIGPDIWTVEKQDLTPESHDQYKE